MPAAPPVSTASVDDEPPRSRRLLVILGGLGALSAVFAGLVIFSSGAATTPPKDPVAPVSAGDHSLIVGASKAPTKVVVYEDFGSQESRTFEISSRDFLRGEAAQGDVVVEYHPVTLLDDGFSAGALAAWGAVLENGKAGQALALHDLIFDEQPSPGDAAPRELIALAKEAGVKDSGVLDSVGAPDQAWATSTRAEAKAAGVSTTPSVRVDGKLLTATSPVALADDLQRLILKNSASS